MKTIDDIRNWIKKNFPNEAKNIIQDDGSISLHIPKATLNPDDLKDDIKNLSVVNGILKDQFMSIAGDSEAMQEAFEK